MTRGTAAARARKWSAYDRDPDDFYIENQWCSQAFFNVEKFGDTIIFDPFCGTGRILDAARAIGLRTLGSDIVGRGAKKAHRITITGYRDQVVSPFLKDLSVVSNPPFDLVDQLLVDVRECRRKCALFLPLTYLAGKARLLNKAPLARVLICSPRPSCPPFGTKAGGGKADYCWMVFVPGWSRDWIGRLLLRDP